MIGLLALLASKLLRHISIAGGTITTTTATHEVRGNGSMPSVGSLPSCQQSSVIEFGDGAKSARYMSGGAKDAPASGSPNTGATSEPDASPSDILGGLGGLLKQFQQNGLGDAINSWIGTGQNKVIPANQISDALGPNIIDALSQRTGIPKDQISVVLSQVLPNAVDQLTPEGRLPTRQEIARLMD